VTPVPVRARRSPPALPHQVDGAAKQEGTFLVQDVYRGLAGVPRGAITHLRIVGVSPKVQPQMGQPRIGVVHEAPGKFILGTVPVEKDGSAYFRLPSNLPVFFQALDREGLAVQTMRSLTYVQAGHSSACIGCHEHRDTAPAVETPPLALQHGPSPVTTGPDGTWPLRFDRLVQPVLNQHCISCHHSEASDERAAKWDMGPERAYFTLLHYGRRDLVKLADERDRSLVDQMPARNSKLYRLLTSAAGHYDVRLDEEDRRRLVTWMDTYAHVTGSFSEQQEEQIQSLRFRYASLLITPHGKKYATADRVVSQSIMGIVRSWLEFPNSFWLGTAVVLLMVGGFVCRTMRRRSTRRR
jgi:mono/diheme cytochrome c family protein